METHTILLMVVSILTFPMLAAYWSISRHSNRVHLDLLCKRDRSEPTGNLSLWQKLECFRSVVSFGWIFLLLVWGAVQIAMGDTKTTMDLVFTFTFALSYVACVLMAGHYQEEDLLNSMGLGQRAKLRYSALTVRSGQ